MGNNHFLIGLLSVLGFAFFIIGIFTMILSISGVGLIILIAVLINHFVQKRF
jgi:hypothetical protein